MWRTVPFLWPQEEHRRQGSCVDFGGHCLLWLLLPRLAVVLVVLLHQHSLLTSLLFPPVSNQDFTDGFLLKFYLSFFRPLLQALNRLPCLDHCVWRHSFRNVTPVDMSVFYSESKTDLKLRCDCCIKIPAIRGCPTRCYWIDGCVLRVTTPQPLQITPALQEACVWALL